MKITKAEFIKGGTNTRNFLQGPLPQVAFSGRSNVGKSSLINRIVGRKNLARTSSTPGRTQEINFFCINDEIVFVDLPGYGYARVPLSVKRAWGPMVEGYLTENPVLRLVILIIDIRRDPGEEEISFIQWLSARGIAHLIVATKVDKEKKSRVLYRIGEIAQQLGVKSDAIIPFSAQTGLGGDMLWAAILEAIRA